MQWETVIGLEVHVQLQTRSKIFSGASTAYGAEPNTQACGVSIALPGVLPVMNREAARLAVMFGLGINAEINQRSIFARKNYFYPDLPKGYQISQFELPIVGKGHVEIVLDDGEVKTVGVTRAHLEEDAGKSLHEDFHGMTGIDLNRAGTPLLEIVSEPDMRSAKEAVAYAKKIHQLVRYIGICDGNMQEGSFRCDANVSIRPKGQEAFGTRAELKNINRLLMLDPEIPNEERTILIEKGKVFVLMTLSMHSTEVGPSQSAPLIAYDLITTTDPTKLEWLDNVVYMMVPSHNPDGMDMVVEHYEKYKGTKYEGSSLPGVYHKYIGHDNNRDFVTLSQSDTKAIASIYNLEWFPQVMVEKHQMGSHGVRYFVPPPHDTIAENIDAGIWNWVGIFGSNMITDMTKDSLAGVSQHYLFDEYWPGSTGTFRSCR